MTAEVEGEAVRVQPVVEETEKTTKEKKPKAVSKEKKPKAAPKERKPRQSRAISHLSYFRMITDAILALNEKSGSSPYAIAKYMEEQHKAELPENLRKILAVQLKNFAPRGKLIKVRASYKLSESGNKDLPNIPKTAAVKRTRSATGAARMKAEAAAIPTKKTVKGKRSSTAKIKQPKSIKSPVVKKVMKITA